jgi:hypothetical protein
VGSELPPYGVRLACVELLSRELANRLEHRVTPVREAQEVLLDERLQRVEVGVDHRLSSLERTAARKD